MIKGAIEGIQFNKINKNESQVITMEELTNNVITLFNNSELKYRVTQEFHKIIKEINDNVKTEDIYYSISDRDKKVTVKTILEYMPTSIFSIENKQRFIFSTEAPFILQCEDPYDLWFCDENSDKEIQIWAFSDFIGYDKIWDKGIYEVYRNFINGRFGCYEEYGK